MQSIRGKQSKVDTQGACHCELTGVTRTLGTDTLWVHKIHVTWEGKEDTDTLEGHMAEDRHGHLGGTRFKGHGHLEGSHCKCDEWVQIPVLRMEGHQS